MEKPESRIPSSAPASALALLLALTIPLSLISFNLYRVFSNPSRVKGLITNEALNSDLVPTALEWFSDRQARVQTENGASPGNLDEPNIALLIPYIDRSAWSTISNELLTEDFVAGRISTIIDGAYSWITSSDPVPRIMLDLQPLHTRAKGDSGLNAAIVAFDELPDCTEDQIDEMTSPNSAGQVPAQILTDLCKLPEPWQEQQITAFVSAFVRAIDGIPAQFAFGDELSRVAEEGGLELGTLKQQLRLLRLMGRLSLDLPLIILLLIVVLFLRSPWALGFWIGVPLIVGGFLAMIWAISAGWLIASILPGRVLQQAPDAIRESLFRIIERTADQAFGPMAVQATVITVLGLGLVGLYAVHSRRANSSLHEPQP